MQQRNALIQAEQATRQQIRDRLVGFATSLWGGMGSWRDSDIDRFVEQIVPRVRAGEVAVARLTDAYLASMTETSGVGVADLSAIRNGVSDEEVYRRPAKTLYTELAAGKTFPEAQKIATDRLVGLVRTDLQLSMTHQAQSNLGRGGMRMFQRTLSGAENCALCAIASTQRYWVEDLLPIHPGCDCGVAPWFGSDTWVINRQGLEQVHDLVAEQFGDSDRGARILPGGDNPRSDYLDLIVVRQHGEYGPTLTWKADKFTGPNSI